MPDPELQEMRRVAAWLERPEWRRYWNNDINDFVVPDGWPPKDEPPAEAPPAAEPPRTFMHDMLEGRRP